jgi:hypothetical protein
MVSGLRARAERPVIVLLRPYAEGCRAEVLVVTGGPDREDECEREGDNQAHTRLHETQSIPRAELERSLAMKEDADSTDYGESRHRSRLAQE